MITNLLTCETFRKASLFIQKKILAEYKVNPPFQTEDNEIIEIHTSRPTKRIMPKGPNSVKTRDPWSYGNDIKFTDDAFHYLCQMLHVIIFT